MDLLSIPLVLGGGLSVVVSILLDVPLIYVPFTYAPHVGGKIWGNG